MHAGPPTQFEPLREPTEFGITIPRVSREDRWRKLGQRGLVIWLTGLSGAGKSTLATGLDEALFRAGKHSSVLDGDDLRRGLCRGLSFSKEGRA